MAFLSATPDPARLAELDARRLAPDEFRGGERALYLWYPNGAGRSKLTNALLERRLGVSATSRNWNTVVNVLQRATA